MAGLVAATHKHGKAGLFAVAPLRSALRNLCVWVAGTSQDKPGHDDSTMELSHQAPPSSLRSRVAKVVSARVAGAGSALRSAGLTKA